MLMLNFAMISKFIFQSWSIIIFVVTLGDKLKVSERLGSGFVCLKRPTKDMIQRMF